MKLRMCITQQVALLTLYFRLVYSADFDDDWDFALNVGDEIQFYTDNALSNTIRIESHKPAALLYNNYYNSIVYVNKQTKNNEVCYITIQDLGVVYKECLPELFTKKRNIHGIAFDTSSNTFFFTDTNERTVNFVYENDFADLPDKYVIKMSEGVPRDIVADECKEYVYWLNTDMTKPTIERARFDGTDREVFVNTTSLRFNTTHTLEPHSLAIDHNTQAIYWFEPYSTTQYNIVRCDLNTRKKTRRVYFIKIKDFPMFTHPTNTLTVINEYFYAVDFRYNAGTKVYIFPLYTDYSKPVKRIHVSDNKIKAGIVVNSEKTKGLLGRWDCEISKIKISTTPKYCVHGVKDARCNDIVCQNYCLQGSCLVNNKGLPRCRCDAGYTGVRCEKSPCDGYCLNSGHCSLNKAHNPVCKCVGLHTGSRCETDKSDRSCVKAGDTLSDLLWRVQKTDSSKLLVCLKSNNRIIHKQLTKHFIRK